MTFLKCELSWSFDTGVLVNNGTLTTGQYNDEDDGSCHRFENGDANQLIGPTSYNWTLAVGST
jgi:hypothetical protein